jgi:Fe-S-cluster containining protein
MGATSLTERYEVSLNTPRGRLTTSMDVPTGFVPVAEIVPLAQRIGREAQTLEERHVLAEGKTISCRAGCAACCRMLVPVSAPEAFALREHVRSLPPAQRQAVTDRIEASKQRLREAGLLEHLESLGETTRPIGDEEMEPVNRAYYALRMPCPFLEAERCTIYEHRPSACRELLVTSPAELCQDIVANPVVPLPVSVRVSTVLGLAWADLAQAAPVLIPLPLALDWADRHVTDSQRAWSGGDLFDRVLDKIWRLLSQELGEQAYKS